MGAPYPLGDETELHLLLPADPQASSSILVWWIPWTEESGGLWSIGLQRVRHD